MSISRETFEAERLRGEAIALITGIMAQADVRQSDVAALLNCTPSSISHLLSKHSNMTLARLAQIGAALGIRFRLSASPLPS